MEKLLARLERRLGRFAVPNLTWVIVTGMAVVYVLSMLKPEFERALMLDLGLVKHGQVWRLFTYLFLPPNAEFCGLPKPIVMLFALYFIWLMGTNLESEWGAFKYNVFWLVGMIGTTIAAVIAGGGATNEYLGATLFLAFATLFPDYQVLFMFIIPVRVKWLGLLSARRARRLVRDGDVDAARGASSRRRATTFCSSPALGELLQSATRRDSAARASRVDERAREAEDERTHVRDLRRERRRRRGHPRVLLREVRRRR